jgi:integrase
MKLSLTTEIVFKMSVWTIPKPDMKPLEWDEYDPDRDPPSVNYLVYDNHSAAPPGFAVRVGKKASVFLIDKMVKGKKLKIPVGLARGKKGDDPKMPLAVARERAWDLIKIAKAHGVNPKDIEESIEASELTLGQVFARYLKHLKGRAEPAKPNSILSLDKAIDKLKDWNGRKVRMITPSEVVDRFDLHAVEKGHKTAAEAMGRWATAAVAKAIEFEYHAAHGEKRAPSLTYNPFAILKTEEKYRNNKQLERDYKKKGIRNPLSFEKTVGPYIKAVWEYRHLNPVACDFVLLTLLWGMRRGESCTFKWRDRISDEQAAVDRWVDMDNRVAFVFDAKNRMDHYFPIAPCAMEILKLRRAEYDDEQVWVFPAQSSNNTKGYYSDPQVALNTIRENAGIKVVRGHDLRRTFGAACEKLGFSDRQTKRMLGHVTAGGESVNRYTEAEMSDIADRMRRVEELMFSKAPSVYNALRPKGAQRMTDKEDIVASVKPEKRTRQSKLVV